MLRSSRRRYSSSNRLIVAKVISNGPRCSHVRMGGNYLHLVPTWHVATTLIPVENYSGTRAGTTSLAPTHYKIGTNNFFVAKE